VCLQTTIQPIRPQPSRKAPEPCEAGRVVRKIRPGRLVCDQDRQDLPQFPARRLRARLQNWFEEGVTRGILGYERLFVAIRF
jgi:hypothetical protein